jgi:excisionase family DNA binding protein
MSINELPQLITPRQLSELTGEHVNTIRRGIIEGRIPADRVGGRWLIPVDEVLPNARAAARRRATDDGEHGASHAAL